MLNRMGNTEIKNIYFWGSYVVSSKFVPINIFLNFGQIFRGEKSCMWHKNLEMLLLSKTFLITFFDRSDHSEQDGKYIFEVAMSCLVKMSLIWPNFGPNPLPNFKKFSNLFKNDPNELLRPFLDSSRKTAMRKCD